MKNMKIVGIAFTGYAVSEMERAGAFYDRMTIIADPDGKSIVIHKRNAG